MPNPFEKLYIENENENENEVQNSGNGNKSRNENENIYNYYINNYIITQKKWFNILISDRIKHAIKYYQLTQLYRILEKIIGYHRRIFIIKKYPEQTGNSLEVQRKINHLSYYLNLNIEKISLIYKIVYKDYFSNDSNNNIQFSELEKIYKKIFDIVLMSNENFNKIRNKDKKYELLHNKIIIKMNFNQNKYKNMVSFLLNSI